MGTDQSRHQSMQVKQVATALGFAPHTVRYYVRRGLIRPGRQVNGYREFRTEDLIRLAFIRKARSLGFTLDEIATIFHESETSGVPCPTVRDIVKRRLGDVGKLIDSWVTLKNRMEGAIRKWRRMRDQAPDGKAICVLIESVSE